eukprot:3231662-Amphidinium_carterae.1
MECRPPLKIRNVESIALDGTWTSATASTTWFVSPKVLCFRLPTIAARDAHNPTCKSGPARHPQVTPNQNTIQIWQKERHEAVGFLLGQQRIVGPMLVAEAVETMSL